MLRLHSLYPPSAECEQDGGIQLTTVATKAVCLGKHDLSTLVSTQWRVTFAQSVYYLTWALNLQTRV